MKRFLISFITVLTIISAAPAYANSVGPNTTSGQNAEDKSGWVKGEKGWRYLKRNGVPLFGWNWVDGKCYFFASGAKYEDTYCLTNTTKTSTFYSDPEFAAPNLEKKTYVLDASGAWTENGVVVDLNKNLKDNEFAFVTKAPTYDVARYAQYVIDKGVVATGEKKYAKDGHASDRFELRFDDDFSNFSREDTYYGWGVAVPNYPNAYGYVYFWDENIREPVVLGYMKQHPEHTYSLRTWVIDCPVIYKDFTILPTSSLVPEGYLPTKY